MLTSVRFESNGHNLYPEFGVYTEFVCGTRKRNYEKYGIDEADSAITEVVPKILISKLNFAFELEFNSPRLFVR